MQRVLLLLLLFLSLALVGCAVNPVTGQSELALIPEGQEVAIGSQQYLPSRQMQGGDFTVDPELSRYVNGVGQKLARVSDRPLPYEFTVLNNGTPNAWALPGGKIAVNRGLLVELRNEAELAAVLAHEIVHAAARHGAKGVERGMLLQTAVMATGIAAQSNEFANLAVGSAQLAAGLVNQKYGRDAERESDFYGMQYMTRAGYDPWAAVTLQETFVRLAESRRQDWLSGLFSSHPPSMERVEANRQAASQMPRGGFVGAEQYQARIAHLLRTRDGYKNYDEGRQAIKNKDYNRALNLARQATAVEPREGLFYGLEGDALAAMDRPREAVHSYNRALDLNPNYFYPYLRRGMARLELRDAHGARTDLERSVQLLPTATGHRALGLAFEQSGDRTRAKEHYRTAAGSDSETGRAAYQDLMRLDLGENPGKYVKVQAGLDRSGRLLARLHNPTPVTLSDLELLIVVPDQFGRLHQVRRRLSDSLPPGRTATLDTGLGPFPEAAQRSIRLEVVGARPQR